MTNEIEKRPPAAVTAYSDRAYPYFEETPVGMGLSDYWHVLRKRRWLILAVLASVISAVAIQTFSQTPIYRSTAQVRIDPESSSVLPYKDLTDAQESYLATDSYLQTQYRVLESRTLAERVMEKLQLRAHPSFKDKPSKGLGFDIISGLRNFVETVLLPEAGNEGGEKPKGRDVDDLLDGLDVSPIRQSRLVEVSYNSHDPELAAQLVNTLVEEFIEQNFEARYDATLRATDFLSRNLEELKIKVERSEEELTRYARTHGIFNIDERENVVLQKLADLNQAMTKVEAELISKTARYEAVRDASVSNFPQALKTDSIIQIESRHFGLEQKLANLSADFGPDWPDVVRVRNELKQVQGQLAREKERAIQNARVEYAVAQDQERRLSRALERQKQIANQLNEDSIQYSILKREVETNKQLYEGLLQRLKEAGVSAGLKSSNIQVVDHGEVPWEVHRPRKALNLGLGLVVGLMVGCGLAFLVEYLDNTVKTPDQVEQALGLPALGVIPIIAEESPQSLALLPGNEREQEAALVPPTRQGSQIWEAYRSLRTSILLSASEHQPRLILVTSSFSGEGKTTTAQNMGTVFAQTGARTLLIDLDMRKPTLARRFGLNGGHGGMSAFLSGNTDLASSIQQTLIPNLYVVAAGPIPPNPAELIGSDRMEEVLSLLGQHFKYVVVDSPPVLSVTDALVVAPKVDGVVMVIHGGKTPIHSVQRATDQLEHVGAKILGAVINNVDLNDSDYYHYYRHYYDYGYYSREKRAQG